MSDLFLPSRSDVGSGEADDGGDGRGGDGGRDHESPEVEAALLALLAPR